MNNKYEILIHKKGSSHLYSRVCAMAQTRGIASMTNTTNKVKVLIIESERGWGQKIDRVEEFNTLGEAKAFIEEYNADNNLEEVPDWYMAAILADDYYNNPFKNGGN